MKPVRNVLFHGFAYLMISTTAALAQVDCLSLQSAAFPPRHLDKIRLIQSGLQTALQDTNPLLQDDKLGPYTRASLSQLCTLIPLPPEVEKVNATLILAEEYGTLSREVFDWQPTISSASFSGQLLPPDNQALNTNMLALAGPPALTATRFSQAPATPDCPEVSESDLPVVAGGGLAALKDIDPQNWWDAKSVCLSLGVTGGKPGIIDALNSIGSIEANLPGALTDLLAPDFASWLIEDLTDRGPRLVGSDDAVVTLVAAYRAENRETAPQDYSRIYADLPPACLHTENAPITRFTAFDATDVSQAVAPVDVTAPLKALAARSFETRAEVSGAVEAALPAQLGACARAQAAQAVNSPEDLALQFSLNVKKAAQLSLVASFADSKAVIEPLVGLTAPSRSLLLSGVRSAIERATEERLKAEVEIAANTLAGAAVAQPELFDTLPEGVDAFPELPQEATVGVSTATLDTVLATVADPDFRAALSAASFPPAPNPDVLKGDVRRILAPVLQERVHAIVTRDMARILSIVDTSWAVTEPLQQAILAAPEITPVGATANAQQTEADFNEVVGLEYPTQRLFEAAMDALNPPLDPSVQQSAELSARREAPDLTAARNANIALPECGCGQRRENFAEVYGFYPFWLAPQAPADSAADPAAASSSANPATAPQPSDTASRLVDFSVVNRVAFYGLEFGFDAQYANDPEAPITLSHETRWYEGQRAFVDSAHLHLAKADLALKVNGWAGWSDQQIKLTAEKIGRLTEPYSRFQSVDLAGLIEAFPHLLDPSKVDGVTLWFDGYDGASETAASVEKLMSLVSQVHEILSPRGQTVNLAFDLSLVDTPPTQGLFSDLSSLLIGSDPVVDLILVFLERPTSNTKKALRTRMERGVFQGIERTRILRRIIPVIPPAGHQFVYQSSANPNEVEFSQYTDDLVYFQDNFAGVGFWPVPDPTGPETPKITDILAGLWFNPILPGFMASFQNQYEQICRIACPNRAYLTAIASVVFIVTSLLIWRSFYSGAANSLAFSAGFAWMGLLALLALLLVLSLCVHGALLPKILFNTLLAMLALLLVSSFYQRARNGPKP